MTHVLIVEDHEENRGLLKMLLEANGYRVTAVGDGLEALAAARRDPPDAVVSDVLMPNMDGFALCRAWMQDARLSGIPFIFYSATNVRPADQEFAMVLGAARYLIKPLEAEVLLRELHAVLQQWTGQSVPAAASRLDEVTFRTLHESALARKIEDKVAQLEEANRKLQESEARFRGLAELSSDWYWEQDANFRFTIMSGGVLNKGNFAVNNALGKTRWELPIELGDAEWAAHRATLEAHRSFTDFEYKIVTDDGSARYFSARGEPLFDAQGKFTGYRGTANDITERRRSDENLRRFRAAMDATADAIYLVDRASMRIIDVNEAACRMQGHRREELLALGPEEVLSIPREELERAYDAVIANGGRTEVLERKRLRKDGSPIWLELQRSARRSGDGWMIVTVVRDITERKQAEERILHLNRVHAMLSDINALIVGVRDRDELLTKACRIAVEAGGFRMTWIGIVDRSTMKIVPVAAEGVDGELLATIKDRLSMSEGELPGYGTKAMRAIRNRETVVVNDAQTKPTEAFRKNFAESSVHSMAMLPLVVADEAIGVFALYAGEIEFFHAEELKLLADLAGDISFALENIDRQRELARLARIRAVSGAINAAIIRIDDSDELFSEACRIAVREGGFRLAWVAVVDRSAMLLKLAAWEGDGQDYVERMPLSLKEADNEKFGMAGCAVRDNEPIIVEDMQHDPRILLRREAKERDFHSLVTLPLVVSDTVVGVIALYANELGFFNESEMKLLLELTGNISFALDYIEKKKKLDYLAYYDALTGLANRSLFLERVAQHMRSAASEGHKLAVFLIDLERFKNINDSLGRPAGDALLRQVADWLTHNNGDASLVARVGADHFATVLPEVKEGSHGVRSLEESIDAFLAHPFRLNDAVFRIAAKIGVAVFPDDGADADTLFRNAEAALKKAKASGERYLFYTQTMSAAVVGKLSLETQLRQALEQEEFVLHYQPKVNLASGKLTGAEALIRWNDPRTGLVPPGRFIPILEETGLIYDVGRWALKKAIDDYLRWHAAGLPAVRIAVNVSPLQLRHRGFIDEIGQAIGVDAQAAAGLEIEITENVIMEDVKGSIASLQAIRALGVSIAIDDFGTGFSSLSYLAKLPVNTLKIDRSFVIEMTTSPEGLALVSTIIKLAQSLKLKVVAEGVETEDQSRLLRLLACDEMQGFLFSKPVPAEVFETRFLAPSAAG